MEYAYRVEDEAVEAIDSAVSNAQQQINNAAGAIEAVAKETIDATVVSSLQTIHETLQTLMTREGGDEDLQTFKSEVRGFMTEVRERLQAIGAPVEAVTAAMNEIAAAADEAIEEAEEAAGEIADGDGAGVPVVIEEATTRPKTKSKSFFGKKKGKN